MYHAQCLTPPLHEIPEGEWICPVCVRYSNNEVRHTTANRVNVHTAKLPANVKSNSAQENREEHVNVSSSGKLYNIESRRNARNSSGSVKKTRMAVLVNSKISQITQQIKLWKYYGYSKHSTS